MSAPSLPSGFDTAKHVRSGRSDCHVTVGFDRRRQQIPRFLVQLHYQSSTMPVRWQEIARMDHNETSSTGHDIYDEGLHVDISRRTAPTVHIHIPHGPLPQNAGKVIRGCAEYLRQEADYFIDVFEGGRSPANPPNWRPDGGDSRHTLIRRNVLTKRMSQEAPTEDALSLEELSEELAEATGTTVEEIERGAEELELGPPEDGTVVDK